MKYIVEYTKFCFKEHKDEKHYRVFNSIDEIEEKFTFCEDSIVFNDDTTIHKVNVERVGEIKIDKYIE